MGAVAQMGDPLRASIADDHRHFARSLSSVLDSSGGWLYNFVGKYFTDYLVSRLAS